VLFDTRLLFMLLCACFGVCACKSTQIVWSAEAASPDGKFVANARTSANSGFGIDGIPATFVYLNWATGSQKPMEIMEFANESDPSNVGKVVIKWLSPRHLEITYDKAGQEIEFQAVRLADVCISVRDSSNSSTAESSGDCPK
jgi:hypothetical protein